MSDTLLELLDCQLQQLQRLEQLLLDERQALTGLSIEQLEQLARNKETLLQQIGKRDQQIGAQPDLQRLTDELFPQKQAIDIILGRCRSHNQANGKIIEHALLHNRQLIDTLNRLRSQNSFTYNSKGRVHGGGLLKKGISV